LIATTFEYNTTVDKRGRDPAKEILASDPGTSPVNAHQGIAASKVYGRRGQVSIEEELSVLGHFRLGQASSKFDHVRQALKAEVISEHEKLRDGRWRVAPDAIARSQSTLTLIFIERAISSSVSPTRSSIVGESLPVRPRVRDQLNSISVSMKVREQTLEHRRAAISFPFCSRNFEFDPFNVSCSKPSSEVRSCAYRKRQKS
jgi:hypothetical protein